jgi:ABC-type branched-subunit amino acid transport system substrate-binding protein
MTVVVTAAACSRGSVETSNGTPTSAAAGSGSEGAPGNGQFGTITDPVCGPAPTGGTGLPRTDGIVGLTADTIRLGTVSDVGYTGAPGLNQELFDASDVFVSWCNSLGGINGHKIQLDKLDARIVEYKQRIQEACTQDFALVGGGGVLDDAGQSDRLSCLLPDFPGYVVTSKARGADLQVQATPGSNTQVQAGVFRYLKDKFPGSLSATGYITGNFSTTITNKLQYQEAAATFGFQTAYDGQYNPVGEPTWVPYAQAIKDKGVKGLYYVGEPTNLGKLLDALSQIDYKLDWVAGAGNQYDQKLIDSAGAGLDINTVTVQDGTTPFLATKVPAIVQYGQLFDKYLPNGKKDASLGLNSFSAWLLFATAAKQCGASMTRKCVYEAGAKVTSWDGGGLSAHADPSSNQPGPCFAIVEAGKAFSIVDWHTADGIYNCDPANVVPTTGDFGQPARLSDVGKSLNDLN